LPTEGTTFLRLSKLPDFRPEIAVAAVLIFAPNQSGAESGRVIRVNLAAHQSLPVFAAKQTCQAPVVTPQGAHFRTWARS
jgi:hypothetical protein